MASTVYRAIKKEQSFNNMRITNPVFYRFRMAVIKTAKEFAGLNVALSRFLHGSTQKRNNNQWLEDD